MRFVAARRDGSLVALFGRVDFIDLSHAHLSLPLSEDLGATVVLTEKVERTEFAKRLREALSGGPLRVDGAEITEVQLFGPWFVRQYYTEDRQRADFGLPWPSKVFQMDSFGRTQMRPAGPLMSNGNSDSYYSDYFDLIARLSHFEPFHGSQDARLHALTLLAWDCSARVAGIDRTGTTVRIRVEGAELSGVMVAGKTTSVRGASEPFRVPAQAEVTLERPGTVEAEVSLFSGSRRIDSERRRLVPEERPRRRTARARKAKSGASQRKVFVVHGRNESARDGMFAFLRSLGLQPIEWNQAVALTGKGAPYIGEVLDAALSEAQAIVVLMTPDEVAQLRPEYAQGDDDPDLHPAPQARPNVLFEAGMALGRSPDRTILVELGKVRPFSDVAGRHTLRIDGGAESRKHLAARLETAGCEVDSTGTDWLKAGDLAPPHPLVTDRKQTIRPTAASPTGGIEVRYINLGQGSGRLELTNSYPFDLYDLEFSIPQEASSLGVVARLPIKKVPAGGEVAFNTIRTMGRPRADCFDISINARTADGAVVNTTAFVNLLT